MSKKRAAFDTRTIGADEGVYYLDANATTSVSDAAKRAMCAWLNKGNPSAAYQGAVACTTLLAEFRKVVLALSGAPPGFRVVVTSGGSESICTMLRGVVAAWRRRHRSVPVIVCTNVEHKATLACLADLVDSGDAVARMIPADVHGLVSPAQVALAAATRPTPALVCVMAANNETGAVNDVAGIGAACARAGVPFFSDAVQVFGKYAFTPPAGMTAYALSMHKVHGPPGVGALVIRDRFVADADFRAMISGSQSGGLRGGTENVSGVAGSIVGLRQTFATPPVRAFAGFHAARVAIVRALAAQLPVESYAEYVSANARAGAARPAAQIVVLTPGVVAGGAPVSVRDGHALLSLPNTLLLSVVSRTHVVCNAVIRDALRKRGFIVSIGSACNTASPSASHVLTAMHADVPLVRGVLRVSMEVPDEKRGVQFARALLAVTAAYY